LSPESKFPVAVNDAYESLRWVVENASRFSVDPERIAISGDSAGGNLTIVTCLLARERGGPKIRYQIPIYPSLDLRPAPKYPSREKWGGGKYILINSDIEWMLDFYFRSPAESDDWRASPILAKSFKDLPPALVVTADHDPLRDEGKLYAERLQKDGVPVEYAQFDGTFHGFVSFASIADVAARAMNLICDRIKQNIG
jgi:acetyl esterase